MLRMEVSCDLCCWKWASIFLLAQMMDAYGMDESKEMGLDRLGDEGADEVGLGAGVCVTRLYRAVSGTCEAIMVASRQMSQ